MIHVAVDIAKASHTMAAYDERGRVVSPHQSYDHDASGLGALLTDIQRLGPPSEVVVGCEATGHYWLLLYAMVQDAGYTMQVFNPILNGAPTRTTVRGRKSDPDDTIGIARVMREGGFSPVMMPAGNLAELQLLCRHRQFLVNQQVNLKKRLGCHLDLTFPEWSRVVQTWSSPTALHILALAPSAQAIASMDQKKLLEVAHTHSHGRWNLPFVENIMQAAKSSLARIRHSAAEEQAVRNLVALLLQLEAQIDALDQQITALAPAPQVQRLQTIPGIGPVLAAIILAEIVSISRFASPDPRRDRRRNGRGRNGFHRLLAFVGLDPRIRDSGASIGKPRMSKRGNHYLRAAIWRAAYCAHRHEAFLPIYEHHRKHLKQPAKVALSHVARKIVQAIYGVLAYDTDFDLKAFRGVAA